MASLNISLPDQMRDWVADRVETGQFASVSDYVHDLILRDQESESQHAALVQALIEGEESGISEDTIPDIIEELRKESRAG